MEAATCQPGTTLYRAVAYKEKPENISSLTYPPKDKVINFQRCNPPQTPMFYGGASLAAVLSEIDVQPGDIVYVSRWKLSERLFFNDIEQSQNEALNDAVSNQIYAYLETIFSRPIHETFSTEYKITAAISEFLTGGRVEGNDIVVGGLKYPSVAHPSRSTNVVITPESADRFLELELVMEMEIVSKGDDGRSIAYKHLDRTSSFQDEKIQWLGLDDEEWGWSLKSGEACTVTIEQEGYIARDMKGNIINPEPISNTKKKAMHHRDAPP